MGSSSSKSTGTSSSDAGKGGEWTRNIYFDPNADEKWRSDYMINNKMLLTQLWSLVSFSEEIENVYVYKHPLYEWQLTSFVMYHLFVVFQTSNWWWSVEKNSEGITIQRSHNLETVRDAHRHTKRGPTVVLVKRDTARKSVQDFFEWLYQEDELNKTYHFLISNCKTFANRVYDYVHGQRPPERRRDSYEPKMKL